MTHLAHVPAADGQIPRGVADYFWAAAYRRRALEQALLRCFRRWGYGDVIPPSFEYADTLARRGNAELQAELCRFLDRDGSMLALRADMTIAVARLVGTRLHDRPLPQRFCYAGSVFRDVEPRAGQQREFGQAGVELIGSAAPAADVEVLALTAHALDAVGLHDYRLVIGQLQYFDGLLEALQLDAVGRLQLLQAVDRNSGAELDAFLAQHPLARRLQRAVAGLPSLSGTDVAGLLDRAERHCLNATMQAGIHNLRAIAAGLEGYGLLDRVSLDLTEIHNLGYYTGITFEVLAPGLGHRLASGGRYDHLVGSFGHPHPAVGVAFGLERLLLAIPAAARPPAALPPQALIASHGDPAALRLVAAARDRGLTVVADLDDRTGPDLWAAAVAQGIPVAVEWGEPQSRVYTAGGGAGSAGRSQPSAANWTETGNGGDGDGAGGEAGAGLPGSAGRSQRRAAHWTGADGVQCELLDGTALLAKLLDALPQGVYP